uniref:Golgi-associated, gamma adaptin ear containing, ARF binding protein 1 n=1 Tax=Anabas testudineus TaxID=64144 RepID=A0A7N6FKR3_ANATE
MAAAPPEEASLQSRINKATNPLNKETDWDSIKGFCDQLNDEPEGPQLATRLLAHKIQSPQEWEAMQALTYLGARAPEPVKKKVLEVMYSWTVRLPDETKIAEAYQMLKKQGIVKQDPVLPDDKPLPPPPPRAKSAIFEDEEKSKMLSRLLNSTQPEDLRAANKLIKEMVQEDQKRVEKVSKRVNAIQEVKESVSLLSQLLEGYSNENCSQSNRELIKDLYQRCEKMRPTLFRLASDTEDNDEALADILEANDSLTQVINLYRQLVQGEEVAKDDTTTPSQPGSCFCFHESSAPSAPTPVLLPAVIRTQKAPLASSSTAPPKAMEDCNVGIYVIEMFSFNMCATAVEFVCSSPCRDKLQPQSKVTLRDLQIKSSTNCGNASTHSEQHDTLLLSNLSLTAAEKGPLNTADPYDNISLSDVTVPLELIKPSSLLPVTVFDKRSLRVLFTFARDCPPSRPDVLVVIISMLSSAPIPVTNIRFQAAVPKVMKVKLQPPSSTELPAFNPILPPAAITQILLLANPQKEKVRLRYKLTFNLGDKSHDESGDVDQFPPPNTWGNL